MDNKKIIWLASYPKSGNTWFRAFITTLIHPENETLDINNLYNTTIASSRLLFDEMTGLSSSDLTVHEIELLRPKIYRQNAIRSKEIIFHKVHDAYTFLPDGSPMIPNDVTKAVLYFIRNPLDVVISFAFHLTFTVDKTIDIINNPEFAFCDKEDRLHSQLRQKLLTWSGHIKSWVDQSGLPLMVMRYEDMLNKPIETFTKAIQFLGLEFTDGKVEKALNKSSFNKLQEQEKAIGFIERGARATSFFRKGIAGDWKNVLSKVQVKRIVDKHWEMMERFGYLNDINI